MVIGGGGYSIQVYKDLIFGNLAEWIKLNCIKQNEQKHCRGFKTIDIGSNKTKIITKFKNIDSTRLAVAIGLSYVIDDFEGIKKYYQECDIEDISLPEKIMTEDNYISKDYC